MPSVVSADGTKIAYQQTGSGPLVVLVDGALCSRAVGPMSSVGKLLSSDFSVVQYDRRGRGESGDTKPYSIDHEVEDLAALLEELKEEPFVFGISSGAALILHAAQRGLQFKKIALFEAPVLPVSEHDLSAASPDHAARLTEFINSHRSDLALKYFLSSMVEVPKFFVGIMRLLPLWTKLKAVAHTLPYDAALTRPGSILKSELNSIQTEALVLWGGNSSVFLKKASAEIAANLPKAQGQELKGQNHAASGKVLAPPLKEFFAR